MSPERTEFLTEILTMAVENGGVGWFDVREYRWIDPHVEPYAVVVEHEDEDTHRLTFGVIRQGFRVITEARDKVAEDGDTVLHNMTTGQRLYLSHKQQSAIIRANHSNDASNLDAVDALAIIECGLFGAVTYA